MKDRNKDRALRRAVLCICLVALAAGVFGEFTSGKGERIGDVPRAPGSDHSCRHLRFAEDVKRRKCGNREAGFFLHPGKDSQERLVAIPAERVLNDEEVFDERAVLKLRDVGLRDSKPFFAQEAARHRTVADELHAGFPAERNERFFRASIEKRVLTLIGDDRYAGINELAKVFGIEVRC